MKAVILLLVVSISQAYSQTLTDMANGGKSRLAEGAKKSLAVSRAESESRGVKVVSIDSKSPKPNQKRKREIELELSNTSGVIKFDRDSFLILLNEYREEHGLSKLVIDNSLNLATEHHVKYLIKNNKVKVSHHEEGNTFDSPGARAKYYGYTQRNSQLLSDGECITKMPRRNLYENEGIYKSTLINWKNSPSHNDILLSKYAYAVGFTAIYDKENDCVICTYMFASY